MDVLSAVSWESVFPIKIAGITIAGSNLEDSADLADSPVCACPIPSPPFIRLGIPVAFWEPSRLIETVKDPYCFPSLGMQLANPSPGTLAGGLSSSKGDGAPDSSSFVQAHYFIFPVWSMLGLLADYACVEPEGFDVAYMTEIDPLWNSDILTAIIEPEAILFANPIAQLACMADAVAANMGMPLDPLFWCMGSEGSAYPLTGHVYSSNYAQANMAAAQRLVYKLSRQLLICDTAINLCYCQYMPIWVKSHYGLQLAKPVKRIGRMPVGRSGLLWSSGKNPPWKGDNFVWVLFKKRACCAF